MNVKEGAALHRELKARGIPEQICSSPRHLSKCCGISLTFNKLHRLSVEKAAADISVPISIFEDSD